MDEVIPHSHHSHHSQPSRRFPYYPVPLYVGLIAAHLRCQVTCPWSPTARTLGKRT